jgi:hypothetical protein
MWFLARLDNFSWTDSDVLHCIVPGGIIIPTIGKIRFEAQCAEPETSMPRDVPFGIVSGGVFRSSKILPERPR